MIDDQNNRKDSSVALKMLLFYFLWISILPRLIAFEKLNGVFSIIINSIAVPFISSTSNFYCWLAGKMLKDSQIDFYIIECCWMLIFSFIIILIFLFIVCLP
jgi:hypothetical protein